MQEKENKDFIFRLRISELQKEIQELKEENKSLKGALNMIKILNENKTKQTKT